MPKTSLKLFNKPSKLLSKNLSLLDKTLTFNILAKKYYANLHSPLFNGDSPQRMILKVESSFQKRVKRVDHPSKGQSRLAYYTLVNIFPKY